MKSVACFVVVLCCVAINMAEGAIRRVPAQYPTIQAGINASSNGDTVLVADSTYYENIRFMGKAIIVASNFLLDADTSHVSRTIIDGSDPPDPNYGSVVSFDLGEDTTSVLCGFTITGGRGSEIGGRAGGGILCLSSAKIRNNIIRGNTVTDSIGTAFGGGIYCSGDYCVIEDNRIEANTMQAYGLIAGGGIALFGTSARISRNSVSWNRMISRIGGVAGGGILAQTSEGDTARVTIAGNRIEGNFLQATQPTDLCIGGGIWVMTWPGENPDRSFILEAIGNDIIGNILSNPMRSNGAGIMMQSCSDLSVIDGNRIIGNKCLGGMARGGGLSMLNSHPTVTNNIIAKNVAGVHAGGIRIVNTVPATRRLPLINNTICYNKAPDGAGIYSLNVDWLLMNSIVWYDTGGSDIYPDGGSFFVVFSNTEDGWNDTGSVCVPPGFADTLYRLPDTSHCIGAGTNSFQLDGVWYYAPPRCINGGLRPNPQGSRSDIGACESQLGGPTDVKETHVIELPETFALEQNYPNPFNPSTTISYQLPTQGHVTLKVFDVLGREVTTLVNETKGAGRYRVEWKATGVASGIYWYRMQAGQFTQTRKLVLVR